MKKVLIVLLVLATSAAFAARFEDAAVVWNAVDEGIALSYLDGGNGFTAVSEKNYSVCSFLGTASNWVFDSNETTVSVSVTDDFFADLDLDEEYSITLMDSGYNVVYAAPYNGSGDYTLNLIDAGDISDNSHLPGAMLGLFVVDYENITIGNTTVIPEGGTFSVRFGAKNEEPVVPEPATYAYGITGLVSVIGIKRKIRK